ncbi:hypothetical protein ABZW30_13920 [Kitasatospora sp. NPDC004669]|uniref:hypothetical protein n=1 Tax=Kitasatospora sp. NPDC004669 TaxID=3154555 RepID=UPI0033BE9E4E
MGVALGGGLSYLAQLTAGRQADRREGRRQAAELAEARRVERLELLREFVSLAQQAARIAEERDTAPDWDAAGTPEWFAAARSATDRLWVSERMIQVLFRPELHRRARAYADAVDHVLWREPAEASAEGPVWDYLQAPRIDFLEAARAEAGS